MKRMGGEPAPNLSPPTSKSPAFTERFWELITLLSKRIIVLNALAFKVDILIYAAKPLGRRMEPAKKNTVALSTLIFFQLSHTFF